jgi:signal transduction histidine kinase
MVPTDPGAYGDGVLTTLTSPWRRAATWWTVVHLLLDLWVAVLVFSVVVTLAATALGLAITFPLAIPVVWLLFVCSRGLARLERSRYRALLGVDVPDPVPPLTATGWWGRWKERFTVRARWRELAHQLLSLPLGVLTFTATVVVWCGSIGLLTLPLYVAALPDGTARFHLFDVGFGVGAFALALVGLVGLVVVAPWTALRLGALDEAVARRFLGPPRRSELEAKVDALESSRRAAVGSAEAERRRIERDLHDGAQQRLVALAVTLGEARERLEQDPEGGRELVAESHEEAKAALAELRDLVRGIHPVILEDRGLDAALSAVAARCAIPVSVDVDLDRRPGAAVESAAYFVVSEALANVTRHAAAGRAEVHIVRRGDRLVVEVRDDGRGGADERRGTGISGLRERVEGLGGWMHVSSPEGGPTTVLVELPCGS